MTTMKTLMLAAAAALTLGAGAAQAQNLTIGNGMGGYAFGQQRAAAPAPTGGSGLVPSGSSDVSTATPGAARDTAPVLFGGDGTGG